MAKKLYVGNLAYESTEEDLRQLFSEFGEISSVNVITDRFSGKSKGFAFVEMPNDAEAEKAIAGGNGKELGGRTIRVSEARPQERRDGPAPDA